MTWTNPSISLCKSTTYAARTRLDELDLEIEEINEEMGKLEARRRLILIEQQTIILSVREAIDIREESLRGS